MKFSEEEIVDCPQFLHTDFNFCKREVMPGGKNQKQDKIKK